MSDDEGVLWDQAYQNGLSVIVGTIVLWAVQRLVTEYGDVPTTIRAAFPELDEEEEDYLAVASEVVNDYYQTLLASTEARREALQGNVAQMQADELIGELDTWLEERASGKFEAP